MNFLKLLIFFGIAIPLFAQQKKPNTIMIMGDDVSWFNIGAYHRGIMAGKTPHLDRLAAEGMLFTDYYAEPSCTQEELILLLDSSLCRLALLPLDRQERILGSLIKRGLLPPFFDRLAIKQPSLAKNTLAI